jgi:hypothetical protein
MAANATNSIDLAMQRQLALMLLSRLPAEVSIERSLNPTAPEQDRVTVLGSNTPSRAEALYIGNADRAHRQDELFVRVWVETIGDDQDDVEDRSELYAQAVEDVAAENPTLGDLDGVAMFGQVVTRQPHDVWQPMAGLFYRWIEIEVSATGRYD